VHGVYKPGNVKLHPELLQKHQNYVAEKMGSKDPKPVFLVFHGGSGSSKKEYTDAISYGVCKVNLDTDLQFAYLEGIRDYILNKKDYLMTQVGNPEGEDKPNKVGPHNVNKYLSRQLIFCSRNTTILASGSVRARRR